MPSDVASTTPPASDRDGFKFRSGRLALDFGATLSLRPKPIPVDLLAVPDDLSRWLIAAGVAAHPLAVSGADLHHARALREALYRLVAGTISGGKFAAEDRALVNWWAARSAPAPQLAASNDRITWVQSGVRGCLAAVARDGVELLGSALRERLRTCAACSILFVDMSRGGTRRWCSMAACGNRAKAAEFRRRHRGNDGPSEMEEG